MLEQIMKKVLIVEDDQATQRMYEKQLRFENFEVQLAGTSAKALEITQTFVPDVILLDIILKDGSNGFDLMEQFKRNRNTAAIPIIVLTNLDSEKQTALNIGAADYIVKSEISTEEFMQRIRNELKRE